MKEREYEAQVHLLCDIADKLSHAHNLDISVDLGVLTEVIVRVNSEIDKLKDFHQIATPDVYKISALYCFWINKLRPFSSETSFVNEILGMLVGFAYIRNTVSDEIDFNSIPVKELLYVLRYKEISTESLALIFRLIKGGDVYRKEERIRDNQYRIYASYNVLNRRSILEIYDLLDVIFKYTVLDRIGCKKLQNINTLGDLGATFTEEFPDLEEANNDGLFQITEISTGNSIEQTLDLLPFVGYVLFQEYPILKDTLAHTVAYLKTHLLSESDHALPPPVQLELDKILKNKYLSSLDIKTKDGDIELKARFHKSPNK